VPDIGWYGLVLVIAAGATAALTVPAKRIALRVGYVAHPGERTVHKKPIPYGGGASMFMGFMVAVLAAAAVPQLRPIFQDSPEMTGVVLAAGAMFAVGLIDDVRDMSAPAKVAGQVLAASILYFSGVTMYELKIPLAGFFVLTPGIVPLITAAWVIALTNAVNLIDGLDGLAAGVVAIGGGALAIYGIRLQGLGLLPSDNIGPLVAVAACGICLGFLPFNFNPARIFMGDAGAHGGLDHGDRRPRADRRAHQRRHLLLLRPPLHPAPHPRGPAGRHGVRLRPAHGQGDGLRHPGQGAHPPSAAPSRPRPSA
jgi:UDP-GlcNAc:undecaprenyl-phosphate GlcNAc-1-phosphate transferase